MNDRTVDTMIDFTAVFSRLADIDAREETATLGGIDIRMVRVAGQSPGRWDIHPHTSETVVVWSGDFCVEFRDHIQPLSAGQCCVIPINTTHRGTSKAGAEVILFTLAAVG